MSGTFDCAQCGGTFTKGWTDEEARAEAERNYGVPAERVVEPATVCDDCYRAVMGWVETLPAAVQAALRAESVEQR